MRATQGPGGSRRSGLGHAPPVTGGATGVNCGAVRPRGNSRRVVERALERYGRIDTLINDAGIYIGKPFTEYTLDDFTKLTA